MRTILWVSQHRPLAKQIAELRRLFGNDAEVDHDISSFENADDIKHRFEEGGYDEMVVVAPLWVNYQLCDLGLKPLWAEMEETTNRSDADVVAKNRYYRFNRFRRITGVVIQFQEL